MAYSFGYVLFFVGHSSSASAAARIGSLPCFGSGLDVWHGNVPRRGLHTLTLGAIAGNVKVLCVRFCAWGL